MLQLHPLYDICVEENEGRAEQYQTYNTYQHFAEPNSSQKSFTFLEREAKKNGTEIQGNWNSLVNGSSSFLIFVICFGDFLVVYFFNYLAVEDRWGYPTEQTLVIADLRQNMNSKVLGRIGLVFQTCPWHLQSLAAFLHLGKGLTVVLVILYLGMSIQK